MIELGAQARERGRVGVVAVDVMQMLDERRERLGIQAAVFADAGPGALQELLTDPA